MRMILTVWLCVLSQAAIAQDALFDMAGSWVGAGVYLDRNITEDVRCRISVTSDLAMTDVQGVCASARRNEPVDFRIIRNADNTLTSQPKNANGLLALDGVLEANGFQMAGTQGAEETALTMRLMDAGTMEMTIVVTSENRTQSTSLLFSKR